MSVQNITNENFDEIVLRSDKPVLVDFWAEWCGPCRMVSPIVDEIAGERDDIVVGKVNVDEQNELAARFGVMSIPTLLVFKGGEIVSKAVGARPKAELLKLLGYSTAKPQRAGGRSRDAFSPVPPPVHPLRGAALPPCGGGLFCALAPPPSRKDCFFPKS